jgi:GNAT superfamily N-acetyltransferase
MQFQIVPAREEHVSIIIGLIKELAVYEKLAHEVEATEADVRKALFGSKPAAEAVIAFAGREPAGFALFFQNFSTFKGKPGLYLEDLFVVPAWRRRGLGRLLLRHLAQIAVERGYGRMEWSVLDWNEMALSVYRGIGARVLEDWRICRLTGESLERLARDSHHPRT